MPLAAALIVSTAWAAATGRLPRWIDMAIGRTDPAGTTLGAPPVPQLAPSAAAAPAVPDVAAATDRDTSISDAPPSAPEAAKPATPIAPGPAKTPTAPTREQSLYAAAHRAHFVEHDPAAALRGWDAYLAAHPDGRFAIEARYNRAISLVRLVRRREAREALTPFAEGRYGGYRRAESAGLLDALVTSDAGLETP